MSALYDPEAPAGYQDADIEMGALEAEARMVAAARRRGLCVHGWRMTKGFGPHMGKCLDCGRIATEAELDEERDHALGLS